MINSAEIALDATKNDSPNMMNTTILFISSSLIG
jgi:hypothetical protein